MPSTTRESQSKHRTTLSCSTDLPDLGLAQEALEEARRLQEVGMDDLQGDAAAVVEARRRPRRPRRGRPCPCRRCPRSPRTRYGPMRAPSMRRSESTRALAHKAIVSDGVGIRSRWPAKWPQPPASIPLKRAALHDLRKLAPGLQNRCDRQRWRLGGFDSLALPPPIFWALRAQALHPPAFAVIHPEGVQGLPGLRVGH